MKPKVYLICNAHIDPVWLWDKTEGIGAAISTFRTAVRFIREHDAFVFNHNDALLYNYIEEYDPALFEEIRECVRGGRWRIMGGWWLQPDCNMPSGESMLRNISEGKRYFAEKFGVTSFDTAINFDPFGHSVGLVKILAHEGYKNYLICRPQKLYGGESLDGKLIRWCDKHGNSVNVYKSSIYGTTAGNVGWAIKRQIRECGEKPSVPVMWGVGNHGGGPSEKDFYDIESLLKDGGYEFVHSSPDEFFKAIEAEKIEPDITVKSSLRRICVGCYTSMMNVKQRHRELEGQLGIAQILCAEAAAAGRMKYPETELSDAWRDLLMSEFHDSLPGSSVQKVEEDMVNQLGHGLEISKRLLTRAFFSMAHGQKPVQGNKLALLVCNPHPYELETEVETEYTLPAQDLDITYQTVAEITDENGNILPSQNEKESSNLTMNWIKKAVFFAKLAPQSVTRFDIGYKKAAPPSVTELHSNYTFESAHVKAVIGGDSGLINSLQIDGHEFAFSPMGKLLVMHDDSDSWGLRVDGFREIEGEFTLATPEQTARIASTATPLYPVRIVEDGEVRTIIEAVFIYRESAAVVRYTLSKLTSNIGISVRLFMEQRDRMIKFSFPTTIPHGLYGETMFDREALCEDGDEETCGRYVTADDGKYAFSVCNNSTYGVSFEQGEIRMSILRTPGYSVHPVADYPYIREGIVVPRMDIGEKKFDFTLVAGLRETVAQATEEAAELLQKKPIPLCINPDSTGVKSKPSCVISDKRIRLSSAEYKDGVLTVRLYNASDENVSFTAEFLEIGKRISGELSPREYHNFKV